MFEKTAEYKDVLGTVFLAEEMRGTGNPRGASTLLICRARELRDRGILLDTIVELFLAARTERVMARLELEVLYNDR